MTLIGIMAIIFRYFAEFGRFLGQFHTTLPLQKLEGLSYQMLKTAQSNVTKRCSGQSVTGQTAPATFSFAPAACHDFGG